MTYQHYLAHRELTSAIHNYNSTYIREVYASITLAGSSTFTTSSELLPESDPNALTTYMKKLREQYPDSKFDVFPVDWVTPPKRASELLNLSPETVKECMHFIAKSANIPIETLANSLLSEPQFNYFKTGNKDLLWTSLHSE